MIEKKLKIEQSDIDKLKMLRSVIHNGKFEINGNAVEQVGKVIAWISVLEAKLVEAIKPIKKTPKIEKIK